MLLIGFGVWAVLDSDAWDFGQLWIQLSLGLFAAAFLVGAAHQSRAALAAERGAEDPARAAVHHLRRWAWGMGAIVLLLVVRHVGDGVQARPLMSRRRTSTPAG